MRFLVALSVLAVGLSVQASAQTCTGGLACLQVTCPQGSPSTTISGTVYAPNGIDPLPNVTVYIPNAPVDAFVPGVQCPLAGAPPSGSPLVGTTTGFDGKFIITNVPVGTNIPLVIVSGRWRRQVVVQTTTACTDTAFDTRFPKNQTEGDIPKIAIATGSVDQVECVLLKVGIDASEFTDPTGTGRINFYRGDGGSGSGGSIISASTPTESSLIGTLPTLNQYDVLMLPCEGGQNLRPAIQLANLIQFANGGGRVYASHFSYDWMWQNPPFNTVANWTGNQSTYPDGLATVNTTFSEGKTLADWLQLVGATTTKGQMPINTIKHDFNGVNSPTQPWLALNLNGNIMQFVFDTPVGVSTGQCGRVLFNEYHVETTVGSSSGLTFPNECPATTVAMTPQEKLLEFSLFELTDDGSQATLAPTSADFGSEPIGFTTAPQTFTWTNNSTFSSNVFVSPASGDFAVTSTNCGVLAGGASCTISVTFTPTALGARTGTLSVSAGAQQLSASLTGTGVPDLTSTPTALNFGNLDVGATKSLTVTITSNAPSPIPFPGVVTTGDYSATSNCGTSIPALGSCIVTVTFKPTATGSRPGTLSANSTNPAYSGITTQLSGNGVDFSISITPTSGTTIAGYGSGTTAAITPIAGFAGNITLSCTTNAVASTCLPTLASFIPTSTVSTAMTITTTSKYTVVGYGGVGGTGLLSLLAFGSALVLWKKRMSAGTLVRCSLTICFLAASSLLATGCSGKLPAQNPSFTAPGTYSYTITATDGFLSHSVTYSLTITAK